MIKTVSNQVVAVIYSNLQMIEKHPEDVLASPLCSSLYKILYDAICKIGTRQFTFAIGDTEQLIYHIVDDDYNLHMFYLRYHRNGTHFVKKLCSTELEITDDMKKNIKTKTETE